MCCHPDLNQYILDVLQTTKPLLEKVPVILDTDKFYLISGQVCLYFFVTKLFKIVLPSPFKLHEHVCIYIVGTL